MASSRNAVANRGQLSRYENVSVQGEITAGQTGDIAALTNSKSNADVVVRKVTINVYTSAAQAFQLQSDGAGGDPVFNVASSPGVGPRSIDFGELGYQLPTGEGLEWALGGTGGNAFIYVIEAYRLPKVGAVTPAQI